MCRAVGSLRQWNRVVLIVLLDSHVGKGGRRSGVDSGRTRDVGPNKVLLRAVLVAEDATKVTTVGAHRHLNRHGERSAGTTRTVHNLEKVGVGALVKEAVPVVAIGEVRNIQVETANVDQLRVHIFKNDRGESRPWRILSECSGSSVGTSGG